jgi:hypothetical protein
MSKPRKAASKTPKRIYLVTATIVDGEHEHSAHCLVRARDATERDAVIAKLFKHDASGMDAEKAYFGYGDGDTMTKFGGVKEISAADAAVLVRLNLVHFY